MAFFLLSSLAPILDQALVAAIKATESASYQIVNTYNYPDYRLVQFNLAVLSHYSYMIISGNEALVVDPGRDISDYLNLAQKEDEIRQLFRIHLGERGEVFISHTNEHSNDFFHFYPLSTRLRGERVRVRRA